VLGQCVAHSATGAAPYREAPAATITLDAQIVSWSPPENSTLAGRPDSEY